MGLSYSSTKLNSLKDMFNVNRKECETMVALAGNPNTGKSTVFNYLTGLKQHTGNWPGKTVATARGNFTHMKRDYILVDLPGTYSLFALSQEEIVARDFICFGAPDVTVVICDATSLERNLNLLFQVMELTDKIVLCVNLIDEALKKGIVIDKAVLENELNIPVVLTSARDGKGMSCLKDEISKITSDKHNKKPNIIQYDEKTEELVDSLLPKIEKIVPEVNPRWVALRLIDKDESIFESMKDYYDDETLKELNNIKESVDTDVDKQSIRDYYTKINYDYALALSAKANINKSTGLEDRDEKIDKILTSKKFGLPIMLALLGFVLWLTITGSNYPSTLLSKLLFSFEPYLSNTLNALNSPSWLTGLLIDGIFKTLAWVISVMLPPMAIFFPIFTLLEDLGYLPRIAFNLDHMFKKACAHGKQCLTMCMGFGCNAAGVIGCRIIDSPRERLIAILTNNFVPCNGRFPTLIAVSTIFFSSVVSNSVASSLVTALVVTGIILIGIITTLIMSYALSKTLLKGIPSTFTLELPPYRTPKVGRIIYSSIIDRTIFVLRRALVVAIPAGLITWILANTTVGDVSVLEHLAQFLDPFAVYLGLDGFILLAFILGFPANEIVIPILLMSYLSTGSMMEMDSFQELGKVLISHGWTYLTALNVMLFSLLHWPCATTLLTIRKETGSRKWTAVGFLLPTVIAVAVCFLTTTIYRLFI